MKGNITFSSTDSYKEIEDKANTIWAKETAFKGIAKNTIKVSEKYLNSLLDLSKLEGSVSECFTNLLGEISQDIDTTLIGHVVRSIGKLRSKMVNQVMNDYFAPFSEFVDFKFGLAHYAKHQVKKSVREYENHLDQFEKANIIKDGKVSAGKLSLLEKELQQLKESINSKATEFGKVMNDLGEKKTLLVLRQVIKCMEVHQSFYNNVILLFDELMPRLEEILNKLEEKQNNSKMISKEGYLYAKRGKNTWNKEYFEVRDEKLYNYKLDKGLKYSGFVPERTMELNLCSVKTGCPDKLRDRLKDDAKRCFQIYTPQKKPLVLLAPSKSDSQDWVNVLLSAISTSLDNSKSTSTKCSTQQPPENTKVVQLLRSISGNTHCVDCNAEDPVWASINLGVLMCVECSGVHRYLGVHITKVRSLTLDHWDPEQLMYMFKVGNEKANQFFERIPNEEYPKPEAGASRALRERYITAKYKEKLFIPPNASSFNVNLALHEMVSTPKSFDVMKMIMLIVSGGDVNYQQNDKTLLSQAVANDNWLYAQALILFGADLTIPDESGWTPFHRAAYTNSFHSLLVLLRNGKDKDISSLRDHLNENPYDIAVHYNHKESQVLLSGDLNWTIPIDDFLETIQLIGSDFNEPFPILVDCPVLASDASLNNDSDHHSLSDSANEVSSDAGEDNQSNSSHIVKTAWKRRVEEKPSNEKKSNRISVLMSSIGTRDRSRSASNTELQIKDQIPPQLRDSKDSKIINLISRKSKRSTIAAFKQNSNVAIDDKSKNSIVIPTPFRKVPPSIEILESFPDFSFSPKSLERTTSNPILDSKDEQEEIDDTTDDEYDEEDINLPDFEPPPPPSVDRVGMEYSEQDIENALNWEIQF